MWCWYLHRDLMDCRAARRERDKEFVPPESIKNNERLIIMYRQPFIPGPYHENMDDMFISEINYSICKQTVSTCDGHSTLTARKMLNQLHIWFMPTKQRSIVRCIFEFESCQVQNNCIKFRWSFYAKWMKIKTNNK